MKNSGLGRKVISEYSCVVVLGSSCWDNSEVSPAWTNIVNILAQMTHFKTTTLSLLCLRTFNGFNLLEVD